MRYTVLILFVLLASLQLQANTPLTSTQVIGPAFDTEEAQYLVNDEGGEKQKGKFRKKLTTVLLTILTGPLGGHRIYLGANFKVPIVYTLTLGGGLGILPLVDLIYTVFSKDYEKLKNSDRIIVHTGT